MSSTFPMIGYPFGPGGYGIEWLLFQRRSLLHITEPTMRRMGRAKTRLTPAMADNRQGGVDENIVPLRSDFKESQRRTTPAVSLSQ